MIITEQMVRDRARHMGVALDMDPGLCGVIASLLNRSEFLQMTTDVDKAGMFVDIILCSIMAEEAVDRAWGRIQ